MNPTNTRRELILDEMGLTPRWVLRGGNNDAPVSDSEIAEVAPENTGLAVPATEALAESVPAPPVAEIVSSSLSLEWPQLIERIKGCSGCGLCAQRKQAVPGVGDQEADWLFIGEGPGAEEDARGEPFVGQAGKLLDAMLAAIGLARGRDVYIANAVKCRPPGNRTPEESEIAACYPYLRRQIALIRPKLIVLLGRAAVASVLRENASLSSLRGKQRFYAEDGLNIPVVVTYHPAYLLRNLPDKAKAWEDLCRARMLMRQQAGKG